MMKIVMKGGRHLTSQPTIADTRARAAHNLERLPEPFRPGGRLLQVLVDRQSVVELLLDQVVHMPSLSAPSTSRGQASSLGLEAACRASKGAIPCVIIS